MKPRGTLARDTSATLFSFFICTLSARGWLPSRAMGYLLRLRFTNGMQITRVARFQGIRTRTDTHRAFFTLPTVTSLPTDRMLRLWLNKAEPIGQFASVMYAPDTLSNRIHHVNGIAVSKGTKGPGFCTGDCFCHKVWYSQIAIWSWAEIVECSVARTGWVYKVQFNWKGDLKLGLRVGVWKMKIFALQSVMYKSVYILWIVVFLKMLKVQ